MAVDASSNWKCTQEVPVAGEAVYYFPEGHTQHQQAITLRPAAYQGIKPVLCTVSSVVLLANKFSNEAYAKIRLIPFFGMTVPLEVEYYPGPGRSIFVVGRKKVEEAVVFPWQMGMRVKKPLDVEGKSGTKWVHGTIEGMWEPRLSPYNWWGMLKVGWEEPGGFKRSVSPWEVEYVPDIMGGLKKQGSCTNPSTSTGGNNLEKKSFNAP